MPLFCFKIKPRVPHCIKSYCVSYLFSCASQSFVISKLWKNTGKVFCSTRFSLTLSHIFLKVAMELWVCGKNITEMKCSRHITPEYRRSTYFGDVKLDHSMKVVSPMFVLGKITFPHTSVLPEA